MDVGRPRRSEWLPYIRFISPSYARTPSRTRISPLRWRGASKPMSSRLALLRHFSLGGRTVYIPFDSLVAIADGHRSIPDSAWDQLPSLATPRKLSTAGETDHGAATEN